MPSSGLEPAITRSEGPIISINNFNKSLSETVFPSHIPASLLMTLAPDAHLAGQLRRLEPTLYKVKSLRLPVGSPKPTVSNRKGRILVCSGP